MSANVSQLSCTHFEMQQNVNDLKLYICKKRKLLCGGSTTSTFNLLWAKHGEWSKIFKINLPKKKKKRKIVTYFTAFVMTSNGFDPAATKTKWLPSNPSTAGSPATNHHSFSLVIKNKQNVQNMKIYLFIFFVPLSKQISISLCSFPWRTALKSPSRMGKKTTYRADWPAPISLPSPKWEPFCPSTIKNWVSKGMSWPQDPILCVIHHNLKRKTHINLKPLQINNTKSTLTMHSSKI